VARLYLGLAVFGYFAAFFGYCRVNYFTTPVLMVIHLLAGKMAAQRG
jgi:hypothetical protein